jgi:hypothetical protein
MAFNSDSVVLDTVLNLVDTFGVTHIVETGTYLAWTTKVLAYRLPNVNISTIEQNTEWCNASKDTLKDYSNVTVHTGHSPDVLSNILPYLQKETVLFYLDAHFTNNFPLNDEIIVISKTFKDNCCIVIDDFKVPNKDLYFDHCENQIPLDLNYIKDSLPLLFSDPFMFFNDTCNRYDSNGQRIKGVGKIYIFPKAWLSKFSDVPFRKEGKYYYI